jgi:hypothetical protein
MKTRLLIYLAFICGGLFGDPDNSFAATGEIYHNEHYGFRITTIPQHFPKFVKPKSNQTMA